MGPFVTESLLEEAQALVIKLREYVSTDGGHHFPELVNRAQQLEVALCQRLAIVQEPEPQIAFIAHKGVGKSTLINSLADLWLDEVAPPPEASSKQLNQCAMLPLGTGGTTPCEICVEAGPWEIRVEPEGPAEARAYFKQFAEWAWHRAQLSKAQSSSEPVADDVDSSPEDIAASGQTPRLQPDIDRIVRGITGLFEHYTSIPVPGARNKRTRRDDAQELASRFSSLAEFLSEIDRLAHLEDRQRLQWLPTGDVRRWVRESVLNIIEGKFRDQPFPKRIILRAPSTGVTWSDKCLPLVDTLGLPAVSSKSTDSETLTGPLHPLAERADLRDLLKLPWTLVVVGSQFNEPPSPSVELLQQMMAESVFFGEALADRTVIAVVDPGKAGSGNFDDAETERAKKEDRCAENIVRLRCPCGVEHGEHWTVDQARERIICLNVLDGGTEELRLFLRDRVQNMVAAHKRHLEVATNEASNFFLNLGDFKRQSIQKSVVASFKNHLAAVAHIQLGKARAFCSNLLHPFADDCRKLHPSTLRSVIINHGNGATQSASAMLESSTTRELTRILEPMSTQIEITAQALASDDIYREECAGEVIAEEADRRRRIITTFLREFINDFVAAANSLLADDGEIWVGTKAEWGTGIKDPGYKERVARRFDQWGVDQSPRLLERLAVLEEHTTSDDTGMLRNLTSI